MRRGNRTQRACPLRGTIDVTQGTGDSDGSEDWRTKADDEIDGNDCTDKEKWSPPRRPLWCQHLFT